MNGSFQVVYSEVVQTALQHLLTQASQADEELGKSALAAVKIIDGRLRSDPKDFGEPCYTLPHAHLESRIAIILPLAVSFAVHESLSIVFVTGFRLLAGTGT